MYGAAPVGAAAMLCKQGSQLRDRVRCGVCAKQVVQEIFGTVATVKRLVVAGRHTDVVPAAHRAAKQVAPPPQMSAAPQKQLHPLTPPKVGQLVRSAAPPVEAVGVGEYRHHTGWRRHSVQERMHRPERKRHILRECIWLFWHVEPSSAYYTSAMRHIFNVCVTLEEWVKFM